MTSKEFTLWLKGFTEGVHEYNITPKQWDLLKEKLTEVSDEPKTTYPFGTPNGTAPYNPVITTTPNTYPWGGQIVWAGTPPDQLITGTSDPLRTIGFIQPVGMPQGSATVTSGSSSTAVFPYSGATVTYTTTTGSGIGVGTTYTTNGGPSWYSINKIENDSREK
jgi:hypothetical protein